MNRTIWTKPEIELLEDLIGYYFIHDLVKIYNQKASELGLPTRNYNGITVKLRRLGMSQKPSLDSFSGTDIATILGVNRRTVYEWQAKEGLPSRKVAKNKVVITKKDFTRWVRSRPYLLYGISKEQLELIIDDRKLINECSQRKPVQRRHPVPVVNLNTGQKFKSIKEAARKTFNGVQTIRRSIRSQRPTAFGDRWAELT